VACSARSPAPVYASAVCVSSHAVDADAAALGAIIGICAALVVCVIALIVFVVVFCNLKIKNDNNIRKRVIANDAFDEVKTVQEAQSVDPLSFLSISTLLLPIFIHRLALEDRLQKNTQSNCSVAPVIGHKRSFIPHSLFQYYRH